MEKCTYDLALKAVKEGKRIALIGWIGKGMFVFQRPSDELPIDMVIEKVKSIPQSVKDFLKQKDEKKHPLAQRIDKVQFTAYLCLYTAEGYIVNGWHSSRTEMLSDEWIILD